MMAIEDVFQSSRGTVVTGKIDTGRIKVGDEIEIVGIRETQKAHVLVEMFRKSLSDAQAGDNAGID